MVRAGPIVRKRVWRLVIIILLIGLVAIGSLIFWQRYRLTIWYLEGNKDAQEMVILQMLSDARPIIERDIRMTFLEKIFSAILGKRNESERRADAFKDIRIFGEFCFKNHMLKFIDIHSLNSLNGFILQGYSLALVWNQGTTDEVLAAFNVNFLKRKIGTMLINPNCNFFTELKHYIEKKAREN
jgi:hypothetical protein